MYIGENDWKNRFETKIKLRLSHAKTLIDKAMHYIDDLPTDPYLLPDFKKSELTSLI